MNKIEHIGIAVNDLSVSIPVFEKLLNTPCYKTEEVASEKVMTAFFKTGESKIELVASTDPEGVIAKYINKKELKIETKIEKEHTNKQYIAKQIAKSHLKESKNYYKNKLFRKERRKVLK